MAISPNSPAVDAELDSLQAAARSNPRLLILEPTPLCRLAAIPGGLDRLFVPGLQVCLPDILIMSAHPGDLGTTIGAWIAANRGKLGELTTRLGKAG
jgi:hypothetical protein